MIGFGTVIRRCDTGWTSRRLLHAGSQVGSGFYHCGCHDRSGSSLSIADRIGAAYLPWQF